MSRPTVYAVMKVVIEIPVRSSNPGETFESMHSAAMREAEGILRNTLPDDFRVAGPVEFSHAMVKGSKS